jgi:general secretion pathway protein J
MSARARPDAGFTLLELLIMVALLAMLSLVLFGGLRFGTRTWEAAENSATQADAVLAVQKRLSERLSAAYPLFVRDASGNGHVAFDGSPERVTFLAPAASPRGALERVTIGTIAVRGQQSLALWSGLELGTARPRRVILLTGLKSFAIQYYGAGTPRERPSWRERWTGQVTPPLLVQIRATFTNRRDVWPDLTVMTHISVDQDCTYDPLTHYCQGRI